MHHDVGQWNRIGRGNFAGDGKTEHQGGRGGSGRSRQKFQKTENHSLLFVRRRRRRGGRIIRQVGQQRTNPFVCWTLPANFCDFVLCLRSQTRQRSTPNPPKVCISSRKCHIFKSSMITTVLWNSSVSSWGNTLEMSSLHKALTKKLGNWDGSPTGWQKKSSGCKWDNR